MAILGICGKIKRAIKNHELKAWYQPQFDSFTKRLLSAEALVRWVREDGSVVMPGQFIPALEESGDILELDWYMLREVCAFIKKRLDAGLNAVPIAINFSRRHIEEENQVERLCETIDSFGIPRGMIEIEVTESAFVEHVMLITSRIKEIRSAGMKVAIDDFGSGLSSLSFIKDISFDTLKLDRSLLSRGCNDEKERIVLESVLNFANRLKLITIAEGVETESQLGFLRTCSCKRIQGFIFSKPLPESEFEKICVSSLNNTETEDILKIQPPSSASQLILDAVFMRFPLVIFANLTRNSFYMITKENFSSTICPSSGNFDDCIIHASKTMHPDDMNLFKETFISKNQLEAYSRGEKSIRLVARQYGDDGICRRVETVNYFVKNPSSPDVLVISFSQNLE